jgi:hypothetical protein
MKNKQLDGRTFFDVDDNEHFIEFDEDDLWENTKDLQIRDLDKTVKSEWTVSDKMVSTLRKETQGLKYDPIPFKADKPKVKKEFCSFCGRKFVLKNGTFPKHSVNGFKAYMDGTGKRDCKGTGQKFVPNPTQLKSYVFEGETYNVGDKVLFSTASYDLHYKKVFDVEERVIKNIVETDSGLKVSVIFENGDDLPFYTLSGRITKSTC